MGEFAESLKFCKRQLPGGLRSFVDARANSEVMPKLLNSGVGGCGARTRLAQSREDRLPRDMIQFSEGYVENWGTVICRAIEWSDANSLA